MKKFYRTTLIAALVLFIVGAASGIASLCLGFNLKDFNRVMGEGMIGIGKIHIGTGDTQNYVEKFTDIREVILDIGSTNCRIIPYKEKEWKIEGISLPEQFSCTQKGSRLNIDSGTKGYHLFFLQSSNSTINIYVPEDSVIDTFEIRNDVGNLKSEKGYLKCRKLEIDSGVGNVQLDADISEKFEVYCDVGKVELNILGEEEMFDYRLTCGIGKIKIGNTSTNGFGSSHIQEHHAEKEAIVECSIGEVEIQFTPYR